MRALARILSWLFVPFVVIVLAWRMAWDRARPVTVTRLPTRDGYERWLVRYASGRQDVASCAEYGLWGWDRGGIPPAWLRAAIRSEDAIEELARSQR